MLDAFLAISRVGIVIPSFIILCLFLNGIGRVWQQTRAIKPVLGYAWEHADKGVIGVGVTLGYAWLIYFQTFIPAGKPASVFINTIWSLMLLSMLRGVIMYAQNLWTSRGTAKPRDEKALELQAQIY